MSTLAALRNGLHQEAVVLTSYLRKASTPPDVETLPDDLIGRVLRSGQQWEAWLTPYLIAHARVEAVAIDVGANIGVHTRTLAGVAGQVVSFEPQARVHAVLARNTAHLPNVTLHQAAASDTATTLSLRHASGNYGAAHIGDSPRTGDETVQALRIDDLHLPAPVSVIKIDAEGHERQVLEGARATLLRDRPAIILEDTTGTRSLLRDLGYTTDRISFVDHLCLPLTPPPSHAPVQAPALNHRRTS